ncbi:hypothetical protein ACJQWK_02843 [Exserohilum turcicum]
MDLLDVYGMCSPRFFLSQEQEELLGKEKKLLFKLSSQPSYNAVRSLFFSPLPLRTSHQARPITLRRDPRERKKKEQQMKKSRREGEETKEKKRQSPYLLDSGRRVEKKKKK